jgi:hypothetical protein
VPCDFITKEKINEFLKKRIKDVAKPEDIRAEELTLKKFGFVPPDFDLAKNTVDLLTEQAAAFYDYDKKKLFITESTPDDTQEPVLAHELSHALADQHFNLGKFIKQGKKSDDGASARLAVMEGQATWLMSEFLARKLGQSLKGFARHGGGDERHERERIRSVSGVRERSALSPAHAGFPVHQGDALPARRAGPQRAAGLSRRVRSPADFHPTDYSSREVLSRM